MSLTDLMSGAGLAHYAVVALVLFFAVFVAVSVWLWWPSHHSRWARAANLPLHDAPTTPEPR
jgi:cbb3-type cytochrome oxidase subunit 3